MSEVTPEAMPEGAESSPQISLEAFRKRNADRLSKVEQELIETQALLDTEREQWQAERKFMLEALQSANVRLAELEGNHPEPPAAPDVIEGEAEAVVTPLPTSVKKRPAKKR